MNATRALELKAQETPETVVVAGVCTFLAMRRVAHTRTFTPLRFVKGKPMPVRNPQRGLPDIVGTLPWGQAFAFEVKRPGGRLREAQAEWILQQPMMALILVPEAVHEVMDVLEPLLARWARATDDPYGRENAMWRELLREERWQTARTQVRDQAAYRLHGPTFRQKLKLS